MRISFDNVSYTYMTGTPFAHQALAGVSFSIPAGTFVSIMGDTGSGKTTALQLIKGLAQPSSGQVIYQLGNSSDKNNRGEIKTEESISSTEENKIDKEVIYSSNKLKKKDKAVLNNIWQKIGYAFQYPEDQLFEETVALDLAFGPKNYGQSPKEIDASIRRALATVGLDYEAFHNRSPLALSGGQMRRVALAGVLACQPEMMILDEPLAGLDPRGKTDLMARLYTEHQARAWTTLCVSHHIDETWDYSDYFLIFDQGKLVFAGGKDQLIRAWDQGELAQEPGSLVKLAQALVEKGLITDSLAAISEQLVTSQAFAKYLAELKK